MDAVNAAVAVVDPHVIDTLREDMNRLRGRLFELVEATGIPVAQQEAFKRLIRRMTYDAQRDLESVLRRANGAR